MRCVWQEWRGLDCATLSSRPMTPWHRLEEHFRINPNFCYIQSTKQWPSINKCYSHYNPTWQKDLTSVTLTRSVTPSFTRPSLPLSRVTKSTNSHSLSSPRPPKSILHYITAEQRNLIMQTLCICHKAIKIKISNQPQTLHNHYFHQNVWLSVSHHLFMAIRWSSTHGCWPNGKKIKL